MNKINTNIQESVLKTLAYYRAVGTPLTLVQVGRYLINPKLEINSDFPENSRNKRFKSEDLNQHRVDPPVKPEDDNGVERASGGVTDYSLFKIKNTLDDLVKKGVVAEERGLYWLRKTYNTEHTTRNKIGVGGLEVSEQNVSCSMLRVACKYIQREKIAQKKINKVRKALKLLLFTPFLKGLFICGSVARKVSRPESDIDFLIITKRDRVWTVRFFLTVFAFLLGKKTKIAEKNGLSVIPRSLLRLRLPPPLVLRRTSQTGKASQRMTTKEKPKNNNRMRIHHSIRKDKFCLNHYRSSSNLKLEPELQDLYSAQEYARMINVYSGNRVDRKFFKKNKRWMRQLLPNFNFTKLPLYERNTEHGTRNTFLENMLKGKIGNTIEKLLFYLQTKKIELGNYTPANGRIIANKDVIMFHLNPRAPRVLKEYTRLVVNVIQ